MHVFDHRYPFAPDASPVPEASVLAYQLIQQQLGTRRTVVVAPSTYGLDNRATLDAVRLMAPHARAVVALSPDVTEEDLDTLHRLGARGVRVNTARGNSTPIEILEPLSRRIENRGWHVELMLTSEQLVDYADLLCRIETPLVIGHMGRVPLDGGVSSQAFTVLLRLLDTGRNWVKLSLASSAQLIGTDREDVLHQVGRALIRRYPERLVWGSDWPHVLSTLTGTFQPDDMDMLGLMLDWAESDDIRRRILVTNPSELYDFTDSSN